MSIDKATDKATNPKDAISVGKLPLDLFPDTAIAMGALGLLEGACKYGKWNWRAAGVRSSVYLAAIKRHTARWANGEDLDPDSGLPHEAHILACIAILVDAKAAGKLTDDRPPRIAIGAFLDGLTPHVTRVIEKYRDRTPRHYSIADSEPSDG